MIARTSSSERILGDAEHAALGQRCGQPGRPASQAPPGSRGHDVVGEADLFDERADVTAPGGEALSADVDGEAGDIRRPDEAAQAVG